MNIKLTILVAILMGMFCSCEPRIDMDMSQWGDHAIITNVQIFKYEVDDDPALYEKEKGLDAFGLRRIVISNQAKVDLENSKVTISLIGEETLSAAGFIFFHESTKVEPLNNSPIAGRVSDLSSKSFTYRLTSADGTVRDWTIEIID
ncbi:hypothetical protein EMN47_15785 [Prolixibacteraceae bacterium JC049]|nr:hypothetical protein [Prolixibacteraceae bacterium JC049]